MRIRHKVKGKEEKLNIDSLKKRALQTALGKLSITEISGSAETENLASYRLI